MHVRLTQPLPSGNTWHGRPRPWVPTGEDARPTLRRQHGDQWGNRIGMLQSPAGERATTAPAVSQYWRAVPGSAGPGRGGASGERLPSCLAGSMPRCYRRSSSRLGARVRGTHTENVVPSSRVERATMLPSWALMVSCTM